MDSRKLNRRKERTMPTSSQALILLTTEGRLPSQVVTHRTFPLCSVPYPMTSHDINAKCVEYNDELEDVMGDISVPRQTRIRLGDVLDNLPNILTIKGYKGALAYDVNSKVMRWKVDTEVPKSRMEAFITYRGDPAFKPEYFTEERVRLPSVYDNGDDCQSENFNNKLDGTLTCRYTKRIWRPPSEQLEKLPVTFPALMKTAIDEETYKRLCNLGFRSNAKDKHKRAPSNGRTEWKRAPFQAWEGPDDYKEKDFRLEDLNLRPNGRHAYHLKMSSFRRDGKTLPLPGNANFTSYPHRQENSVTFSENDNSVIFPGSKDTVYIPGQEATVFYNGHGPSSMKDYSKERDKFFAKYGKYTSDTVAERSEDSMEDSPQDIKLPAITRMHGAHSSSTSDLSTVTPEPDVQPFKSQKLSLLDNCKSMANYNRWKKQKLTRLRLRKEIPEAHPLSVCFSLRDNAKSHEHVKNLVEEQVGCTISSLQFDPISVHALDNQAKSRWIVTFPDQDSCDSLLSSGLIVEGHRLEVQRLDDLLKEEVEAYKLYQMVQKGQIRMPSVNTGKRRKDRPNGRST